jgi:hypothetical protein
VTAVLESIQDCIDPDVKAAVAAISQDNGGMCEDFERAVTSRVILLLVRDTRRNVHMPPPVSSIHTL